MTTVISENGFKVTFDLKEVTGYRFGLYKGADTQLELNNEYLIPVDAKFIKEILNL